MGLLKFRERKITYGNYLRAQRAPIANAKEAKEGFAHRSGEVWGRAPFRRSIAGIYSLRSGAGFGAEPHLDGGSEWQF